MNLLRLLFYRIIKTERERKKSNAVWRCCRLSRETAVGVLCTEHMKEKVGEQTPTRKRLRNYLFCRHFFWTVDIQMQRTRVEKIEAIGKMKERRLAEFQHHN